MKQIKFLAVAAALLAITSQTQVFGLTITQVTGTPTGTISQIGTNSSTGGATSTLYNSGSGTNTGGIIQAFKITSSQTSSGYFNAAEITHVVIRDNTGTANSGTTWYLRIGTLSGGTFAAIDTESFVSTSNYTANNWYDFQLSNYVTLSSTSATYAFNITSTGDSFTAESASNANVNWSAGANSGVAGSLSPANFATAPAASTYAASTGAISFYISTTPVPEPSTWAIVPVLGTLAFLGYRRFRAVASV